MSFHVNRLLGKAPIRILILQVLITIAAYYMLVIFLNYFSVKNRLSIPHELSARQIIHMKCQVLLSLKNDDKRIGTLSAVSAAIFLSILRVKCFNIFLFFLVRKLGLSFHVK